MHNRYISCLIRDNLAEAIDGDFPLWISTTSSIETTIEWISKVESISTEPWMIIGDLNEVTSLQEKFANNKGNGLI